MREDFLVFGSPRIGQDEIDEVVDSLKSGWISTGPKVARFEALFKNYIGADYALNITQVDPMDYVMELTDGIGADCVIEAVGHFHTVEGQAPPLAQAVAMVRNGGRIVTTGLGDQETSIHFKTLVLKEAELIASRVTLGEFPRAIRMLEKGVLHPELLITHQLPMREIKRAFDLVDEEQPDTVKIVLAVQEI